MMYQQVNDVIEQQDCSLDAAEAHGMAVGMLTVETRTKADNWLQQLNDDNSLFPENQQILLRELFEQTRQSLNAGIDEFSFDLLLPEDEEPLAFQIEAMRNWCQGFLFGIGYTGSSKDWPPEINEVILDIVEFTKLDSDVGDEDDEYAFNEIREYLRAAVFTIGDYFTQANQDQRH
jgi:uncharacterized protein YgfB (UPF0149 family)